jgi:3-isopropylmalate/(R)-2-methylmalate dehydratase large subunit
LCAGRSGGILAEGDRIISSNNRNFLGRMGSNKAEIYLGSPATVAASSLEGKIVDPRKYL